MKIICIFLFLTVGFLGFSQERLSYTYKFSIKSIETYAQAKPYYDQIRVLFSESKSVNHLLFFDSKDTSFKTTTTIYFNKESLREELQKIGLDLSYFIVDGEIQE